MTLVFNAVTAVQFPVTTQCTSCHVTRQVTMPPLFLSLVMHAAHAAPRPGLARQDNAGWFPRKTSQPQPHFVRQRKRPGLFIASSYQANSECTGTEFSGV
ncbi:unnamed protein product [Ectocarpus sp. 13 AM-2016]